MFDTQGIAGSIGLAGLVNSPDQGIGTGESMSSKRPSVLLVDDDPDSLVLLSFIFEQYPCTVICASDGREAIEYLHQIHFDLVMLDIQLPGLSGLDVVRTLRTNPTNADVPVVAVTALAREQDRVKILEAGCNFYISKPFLLEDMERLIGQHLKSR
jgi:two-component system cell cycle response regulator DivK